VSSVFWLISGKYLLASFSLGFASVQFGLSGDCQLEWRIEIQSGTGFLGKVVVM
jgi:hypothetical protein